MLRIHPLTSAAQAASYYASADYYASEECVGMWGGKLAALLGLSGEVDQQSFERMCHGLKPEGSPLTMRQRGERRVGWDLTFSGSKSYSILQALAPASEQKRLRDAFDLSVRETMREIESDVGTRIRKDGADADRTTGNVAYAWFDHSTSRPTKNSPPDMHWHRHVVVFNATHDAVENRIKAAQIGDVVRDKWYYQGAFFSRLAHRLEGMGYAVDRRGGLDWQVAGIEQRTIDTFSKRTAEVEAEAERLDISSPARKAELGKKTRMKKAGELTPEQLQEAWWAQLSDHERDSLAAVYARAYQRHAVTVTQAVSFAIEHLSEQNAVWPLRDLKRVALMRGLGSILPEEIEPELPQHGVIVREKEGRLLATTKQLQREEDFIIGFAAYGRGSVVPAGVPSGLTRTLAGGGVLNDGQWEAVKGVMTTSNRVSLVQGPAGSGKSWMLKKLDEGLRLSGRTVTYLAATTDAASVLKAEGFDAKTVAHFLLDEPLQESARHGHLMVDESSLLGHQTAFELCRIAQANDVRVTFIGDPRQHASVPRGSLMRLLTEYAGIRPFQLAEIKRQKNPLHLAAVKQLFQGKTAEGFEALVSMGSVKEVIGDGDRCKQIATEYISALKEKKSVICIAPTHREGALIATELRAMLRTEGMLSGKDREVIKLVAVNASTAERRLASTYRVGDVLQYTQNAKGHTKGEQLVVTEPAAVPLSQASAFQLYRPEKVTLAVGDRVRFTGTVSTLDGKHKLRNGDLRTITGFDRKGNIRLDNGWSVASSVGHLRLGWTDTSFSSQGRTVDRAIVAASTASLAAINQEMAYVSSSRSREKLSVYTDDLESLRRSIQKSSQKLAAVDLRPKAEPTFKQRLQSLQERRRRFAVVERMRAAWNTITKRERQANHGR